MNEKDFKINAAGSVMIPISYEVTLYQYSGWQGNADVMYAHPDQTDDG